jgi:hypothetical protein
LQAGLGGAGNFSSISGSSVGYAGGGAGVGNDTTYGGGRGGSVVTAGTTNTGGGGGALVNGSPAGNGGSGVVIIRYSNTFPDAAATTGSPTLTNTGGFKIYRWTASGSITF